MPKRVVVFLDYQNVYRRARDAFTGPLASHWDGQIDPLRLGNLIARRMPDRELHQVRVYRGRPSSNKDPKGYGACMRQCARWRKNQRVHVFTRSLRYPRAYPAQPEQEKGVDVQLAVDYVAMAMRREYDVGVLMSEDTDLRPALEVAANLTADVVCEVATWMRPSVNWRRGFRIHGGQLWCHYLSEADYRTAADPTDYTQS